MGTREYGCPLEAGKARLGGLMRGGDQLHESRGDQVIGYFLASRKPSG